jgi:hypothetical protein
MKTLLAITALLLLIPVSSRAQDLEGLFEFAHYPLINTQEDALGLQNPMVLTNTVYDGTDGIYFNGKHPVVDQGGSWARTMYMSALSDAKFAVQVEFRIEDFDDQFRCIVICGLDTYKQYLGFFILSNDFTILLSNGVYIDLPDVNPQENVWYKFTMIYDTVSNNAKFYLGNNLIESGNQELVRVAGDAFVSNYFPAAGYPLKGNWRNLRIYGSHDLSVLEDELNVEHNLKLFPNPATNVLHVESQSVNATHWRINAMNGESWKEGNMEQVKPISVKELSAGVYFFQLLDKNNRVMYTRKFLKL